MRIDQLLKKIEIRAQSESVMSCGQSYTFGDLGKKIAEWEIVLSSRWVKEGQVVGLRADYSIESISLLLALWLNRNIVAFIPLSTLNEEEMLSDAQVEHVVREQNHGPLEWESREISVEHPLLLSLQQSNSPGFVIFSSGSTGKPKAILHDVDRFLSKFDSANKPFRTLVFLLFDHIAGLDTLFYVLCSGGVLVIPEHRDAKYVCSLIAEHHVEILPTSPTFLNLLCLSQQYETHNLSSLKIITYGSEPMNQHVLNRLQTIFPHVKFIQKYGSSELGSPRSQSKKNNSLWMKIKDDQWQTKVVDNILWIKSHVAMLGYLNIPDSAGQEGWFSTGDEVVVDGDWIKILGRKSDVIIVGGEKVYPGEIESVLMEMPNISDVTVRGEPHPLMGNIIIAKVQLSEEREEKSMLKKIRKYCRSRISAYKIPVKIEIMSHSLLTNRHKKLRS